MQEGYSKLVSDAGGFALAVEDAINQTDPRAINDLIAFELPQLQVLTQHLEQTHPPADASHAHAQLVVGLRALAVDLMAVQTEATLATSAGDVYQTGVFFPSVDVVESGGRMRWELANSHGLARIREALAELKTAGWTADGLG